MENRPMDGKPEKPVRLLCVTGLTPQVVTETLYAMHQAGNKIPVHIVILTTAEGAERAKLTLLKDNWLARFYRDYQLTTPKFDSANIRILTDQQGEPLMDIRSRADNQAMADGITETIRQMTADPNLALHVSIAGGRKTMGFYAGYALSLYGRSQDRLSHVLVSADYESHPQFYYPTPESHIIYGNDPSRKPLDTQKAEVVLADIAFVRLRHGLDKHLLEGRSSFSDSVKQAQQALGPAQLEINLQQRQITAQGTSIKLSPAEMAFYHWLIQRQINDVPACTCPSEGAPEPDYAKSYRRAYQEICGELGGAERTLQALETGMSKAFFEQRKSRINKLLKQTLQQAAPAYLITPVGKRPRTRYQVKLDAGQINYR